MAAALRLDSTLKLNDGGLIPRLGLGVYLNKGPSCVNGVKHALKAGYRHVDR
jgi:diketogulonate reductase-like aldo/keto reductase